MISTQLRDEVAQNYDQFQRTLLTYLATQAGRYALIRHQKIVGFYETAGAADLAGANQFEDQIYSIQRIAAEPVELGVYAHAID